MKPFASIIIPVFNQLHYTKQCIESLLKDNDRAYYEIIVIDNGSTDGTTEYLKQKARDLDGTKDSLKPIFNPKNLGVAPAWNQGCAAATGEYLAVLNNDVILSNGWLRGVVWAMETYNLSLASPFAATGKLDYDFETKAAKFTAANIGAIWDDYDFCTFVMHSKLYQKLGPFDEKFLVGGYEDTDYVYRLRAVGKKYGVTGASYIHHFGSSTLGEFKKLGDKHVGPNRDYFISKWGEDPSAYAGTMRAKVKRSWRRLKLSYGRM